MTHPETDVRSPVLDAGGKTRRPGETYGSKLGLETIAHK